jgi:hypothetical protein
MSRLTEVTKQEKEGRNKLNERKVNGKVNVSE